MSYIVKKLSIAAGKAAIIASRMAGNQGTDFPGRLARRIYRPILHELAASVDRDIIIVTGTNGKTTTANMIAAILKEGGYRVVHNRAGANMVGGITTAFIKSSSLLREYRFDYALLETDEANVPLLLKELDASYLLVTNFFRDQLDRYGELDTTIGFIKDAAKGKDVQLVLNADDPLIMDFQEYTGTKCCYYGFANTEYDVFSGDDSREGRYCMSCGEALDYQRFHYAQLGKYQCPGCGRSNPVPGYLASGLRLDEGISMKVNDMQLESSYQGFYNAYNILAAAALASTMRIPEEQVRTAILNYQPRAGRLEHFEIGERPAVFVLVKNPTGLNQTVSMLCQDPRAKSLFVALNDNAADGRDISWIWDADIEDINLPESAISKVFCSGQRSGDMALRIKYADFPEENICENSSLEEGIRAALEEEAEVTYILSTYTALIPCRRILQRLQKSSKNTLKAGEKSRA